MNRPQKGPFARWLYCLCPDLRPDLHPDLHTDLRPDLHPDLHPDLRGGLRLRLCLPLPPTYAIDSASACLIARSSLLRSSGSTWIAM